MKVRYFTFNDNYICYILYVFVILGSDLYRNVSKIRRLKRVRIPLMESIRAYNMREILEQVAPGKKSKSKYFTYHKCEQWNFFIHDSTTQSDRGVLFNLQMCLCIRSILQNQNNLRHQYGFKFFKTGHTIILSFFQ
jgi:hypothetical protein